MKKCIYCGKEMADDALWCPWCEKDQQSPREIKAPVRTKKPAVILAGVLAAVCVIAVLIRLWHAPKEYEGGAGVSYKLNGKECSIYLGFSQEAFENGPQPEFKTKLLPGDSSAMPSQLFARSPEGENMKEAFAAQVKNCEILCTPEGDADPVDIYGPKEGSGPWELAVMEADIVYRTETQTNTITWEMQMKNGDKIRLYQTVTCEALPALEYHYQDTPMNTVEEIEALLEKTAREEDPETVLSLYLPPVSYEGKLVIDNRTARFFGTEENGKKTTFTDTLTVSVRKPSITEIYDIDFAGEGGTGIEASEALRLQGCLITGWDTGIDMKEGGWVHANNIALVENGTGFRMNAKKCSFTNPVYENIVFAENGIGLKVENVPGNSPLTFLNPVFDGNETDIEDPAGLVHTEQGE